MNEEPWRTIEAERRALADLLEGLAEPEWDAPSLCDGWRVRDVAAHVTLSTRVRPLDALVGLIRARGDFNRYVADEAKARASRRSSAELIAELRSAANVRRHPPGTKPEDPLVDVLVHTQDIARPLGIAYEMPIAAAKTAADRVWSMSVPFHAKRRCSGARIVATDTEWSRGDTTAPEARGPISDILLVIAGRAGAVSNLDGPGAGVLASRLAGA